MPDDFGGLFEVLYSNSFDQSVDPVKTANEWVRIIKNKGYAIIDWVENDEPTYTDPDGRVSKNDILKLFKGDLIHYSKNGNFDPQANSSCIIVQVTK